jgi:hypothetical protein
VSNSLRDRKIELIARLKSLRSRVTFWFAQAPDNLRLQMEGAITTRLWSLWDVVALATSAQTIAA